MFHNNDYLIVLQLVMQNITKFSNDRMYIRIVIFKDQIVQFQGKLWIELSNDFPEEE